MEILDELQGKFEEEPGTAVGRDVWRESRNSGITGDQIATPDHVISESQRRGQLKAPASPTSPAAWAGPCLRGGRGASPLHLSRGSPRLLPTLAPSSHPTSLRGGPVRCGVGHQGETKGSAEQGLSAPAPLTSWHDASGPRCLSCDSQDGEHTRGQQHSVPQLSQPEVSPDVVRCARGGKMVPAEDA